MEEKVLYVKLPENTKYRRVMVTGDKIGIVYSQKSTKQSVISKAKDKIVIPKPQKLAEGTEVYKKREQPYWFCRIKNGRDEFMHLYMEDLTEEDLYYDSKAGNEREFITEKQQKFRDNVLEALKNKPKEGNRWLPVFEPTFNYYSKDTLQFVKGDIPLSFPEGLYEDFDCLYWEHLVEKYSLENDSGICSIYTYFLQGLRWLKDGYVTLEQLADDSKDIGHYIDSKNAKYSHRLEKTGTREIGGLYGLIGNSFKIVKNPKSKTGFSVVGGRCTDKGEEYPFANVYDCQEGTYYLRGTCVGKGITNKIPLLELKS